MATSGGFYILDANDVTASHVPGSFAKTERRRTHVNSIKYRKWFLKRLELQKSFHRSILAPDSWKEIFSIGNNEIERFSRVSLREQFKNGLPKDVKRSCDCGP